MGVPFSPCHGLIFFIMAACAIESVLFCSALWLYSHVSQQDSGHSFLLLTPVSPIECLSLLSMQSWSLRINVLNLRVYMDKSRATSEGCYQSQWELTHIDKSKATSEGCYQNHWELTQGNYLHPSLQSLQELTSWNLENPTLFTSLYLSVSFL